MEVRVGWRCRVVERGRERVYEKMELKRGVSLLRKVGFVKKEGIGCVD